jgi:hypothetical protein
MLNAKELMTNGTEIMIVDINQFCHAINANMDAGIKTQKQNAMLHNVKVRAVCLQGERLRALKHLEEAQHWLQQRTIERMRRGVEGTHTV